MTSPWHFLAADDLTPTEMLRVLDLADEMKRTRGTAEHLELAGKTVAMIFEKPSTRTRVSFQVAVSELGGHPLPLSSAELQLGRGETIGDTGSVLSRYVHAIVVRTFAQQRLTALATTATVPVVNALSDEEHPCQALADLQTFREAHGSFEGKSLAYVGDGNNVAHSLLVAGAMVGLSVRIAHPVGYAPDAEIVARAQQWAAESGAQLMVTTQPQEAVDGAHAVYTDVWASMGQEDEHAARLSAFAGFQVDDAMMSGADDEAIFLHCLPAHRDEEVSGSVIDGAASRVFDQAENRLHAQKALLATLFGGR